MLKLLVVLLVAQGQPIQSIGERFNFHDPAGGATPVTDKDLRPMKAPDCRTEAEIQLTLEQLSHGESGDCFIRDINRLKRQSA